MEDSRVPLVLSPTYPKSEELRVIYRSTRMIPSLIMKIRPDRPVRILALGTVGANPGPLRTELTVPRNFAKSVLEMGGGSYFPWKLHRFPPTRCGPTV